MYNERKWRSCRPVQIHFDSKKNIHRSFAQMKCPEDQQPSFALHFQFQGCALAAPGSLRRLPGRLTFFHIETKTHAGHPGIHKFIALGVQCAFVTSRKLLVIACRGRVDSLRPRLSHTNSLDWYLLRITIKFRKSAPALICFFFGGPYFWRGLYSEGLIYGRKFAFQNRLG